MGTYYFLAEEETVGQSHCWRRKDLEGSGCNLIEVISQHLFGGWGARERLEVFVLG
jgi:hypothetical protein